LKRALFKQRKISNKDLMDIVKIWARRKKRKASRKVTTCGTISRKGKEEEKGKRSSGVADTPFGYQLAQSIKRDLY